MCCPGAVKFTRMQACRASFRSFSWEESEHWMALFKPAHWQVSVDAKEAGSNQKRSWDELCLPRLGLSAGNQGSSICHTFRR